MSRARPNPHRSVAAGAISAVALCSVAAAVLAGTTAAIARRQRKPSEGGTPEPRGRGSRRPGRHRRRSCNDAGLPRPAPETLPPPPVGGFGFPNPAAPPYSVNNEIPTLISPPTLRLPPSRRGCSASGLRSERAGYPVPAQRVARRDLHRQRQLSSIRRANSLRSLQLGAGVSVSVDTPRLQAVATGQANGYLYLPSSNSSLNQIYRHPLCKRAWHDLSRTCCYVDAQSSITQSTTLPGFGFQNLSTLPRNQQTQQFINNISPYLIKSFGSLADTELRYTFSSSNYGGNTADTTSPLFRG